MTIEVKSVDLPNGETLGYRIRNGGQKTLLLIHGNMTSSKHWDVFIDAMPLEYNIVALDLRGYGLSTYNKQVDSIKDFSNDVKLFVDALSLKDFAIMGWSLGGTVTMQFVADYPEYAAELILLGSGSTRGFPIYGVNADGRIDYSKRLKTREEIKVDPIRSIPIETAYAKRDKEFLKLVWRATIYDRNEPSPEKFNEYMEDCLTQRHYADTNYCINKFNISKYHNGVVEGNNLASTFNIPILVLYGEKEKVIPKSMQEELLSDLPEKYVTYVELKECGHSPLVDDVNQLVDVIKTFLVQKVGENNEITK
jgi:pimeloyl-ACP methyl ester carboxylesterase